MLTKVAMTSLSDLISRALVVYIAHCDAAPDCTYLKVSLMSGSSSINNLGSFNYLLNEFGVILLKDLLFNSYKEGLSIYLFLEWIYENTSFQ